MQLFFILMMSLWLNTSVLSAEAISEVSQLKQLLDEAETVNRDASTACAKQYPQIINDFPRFTRELQKQITLLDNSSKSVQGMISSSKLDNKILISSQMLEDSRQRQHEKDSADAIIYSLSQLPQQQGNARQKIIKSNHRLQSEASDTFPQGKLWMLLEARTLHEARCDELKLAQFFANNRQKLVRILSSLHQCMTTQLNNHLQILCDEFNEQRQRKAEVVLSLTEQLVENSDDLPTVISKQFLVNRELSDALKQQTQRMELVVSQQRMATEQIIQVRQALSTLREQSQWLSASNLLGEALRAQVARLPAMPKPQQIDSEMAQLRVQRLRYEDLLRQQDILHKVHQANGFPFTNKQHRIFDTQLKIQSRLLNALISGCDTLILEITKLKVANTQLKDVLTDVKDATHRYLFWTADVSPIGLNYPVEVARDLSRLMSLDTLNQMSKALAMMFTTREMLLPLIGAGVLVGFSIKTRTHFNDFLAHAANKVGKVTQDRFSLTIFTFLWSILVALPLPVLWAALGYGLQHAWPYPIAIALGDGITATLPLLWVFMISAVFARSNGLFVVHFRWAQPRVARATRYYSLTIGFIVPLMMLLIAFSNMADKQFAASIGRLCFILICGALSIVTVSLKRAGIPLYLDKEGNGDNMVNQVLWNLMIALPLAAALASMIGYLATVQALLARLETSVAIWFLLLVIYHIIRRWMLIQRRRIAFDRARQRRADILASRARNENEKDTVPQNNEMEIEEPVIDLDTISAQSLRLVRSLLTLIALVSVIVLWSEIHSAFGFLENIRLWDVNSTVQGIEIIQQITLGSVLIAILVLMITTQLVRNMPALLELAILQHLSLTPGTGYAITTLTKYILMLLGSMIGFSMIGIEWSKLQWLVAALSVGLGFGLQEIFANFISGLIILFEKPIRIGDTVTIRDLTGSITRINTRATTIIDWDRKEIIVPNKAFITEQFINWSLSDSVTRVVLTIPAPTHVDSEKVTTVLKQACERCSYVLDVPVPDVFLVDLQQGIQLFELRIHAAEMGHRMPLRHELHQLILRGFAEHGIEMPFPPFQVRMEMLDKNLPVSNRTLETRTFKSGGL
ncbi:miniconductance mechanosensitive channel MscM [Pantoea sp. Nvir]|uniref:miniconductance mechanosensitive channel MscM n=1 Tax=Pantoea sp. Nvir TaxID=2576760 RepID=UPI0027FCCB39|nr:miniconductance mechanosensitive channel MscM [Pantoea sp. Nvir]CAJ0990755.1 Miniconductance mechanosensitive channel MscM [Pantoea sp. Nvir]